VYVLALRELLGELGIGPDAVAHDVYLICPENFSNRPTATVLDVRKQLTVIRRQLSRLDQIDSLLPQLPLNLSFDLEADPGGVPHRPPDDVAAAVGAVQARYAPECLATCEMCFFCRHEAQGSTAILGRAARDELGGVEYVARVLEFARGLAVHGADQAEAGELLRAADRLRRESLRAVL
jgi:hypothetical protein